MSSVPPEAVIEAVRVAAAHDGDAELLVALRFRNGGLSHIALDAFAACHLLEAVGAASADALVGVRWEHVRDALAAASARYLVPQDFRRDTVHA
jgi:hypothetical protein